jgi:putative addiction module component (TIGR02574 family)
MSIEDRLALVQAIWDNIAASTERPPIDDAMREELDRRWADHLANPTDVVPWEEAKAATLARIKR